MVLVVLVVKIKTFLVYFVSIFRRALCCFRRRRRLSDSVPLTGVGVVSNQSESDGNWSWDDQLSSLCEPRTVQDHIDLYRKRKQDQHQVIEEVDEEALDYFEDMTPRITKQKKLFVDNDQRSNEGHNRLTVAEIANMETGELREWEEAAGWEGETLDWDAQQALREKKRQDRERKLWEQQQKRQEKVGRALGAKLNT